MPESKKYPIAHLVRDLPMLSIAGLGVAFHAKPVVRESARHAISTLGLDSILYLLGVRDRELGV